MAKFAFILPREQLVEPAGRIARELGIDVVLNKSVPTEQILEAAAECKHLGADIIVARGRQASILKENTDFPVVEIQLTGQEIALLLHRARNMVPRIQRPKIGVVTIPNMIGDISAFAEVFSIQLHTYFVSGNDEMEQAVSQAVADGMDVILGGDFVNAYCRRLGKRTLFLDSTEDSIRTSLKNARSVGFASDAERRNTAHLQVLLDYSFNGIIELDVAGKIVRVNDVACKIINRPREQLEGVELGSLMPPEDAALWSDTMASTQELYATMLSIAGVQVVANAAFISTKDVVEGMIFSFYEMQKFQRQGARALRESYRLQRYLAYHRFEDVKYAGRQMQHFVKQAKTFAATELPILIQGEVGSGKSMLAQCIHNASPCSRGPFVTFHCGAGWDEGGDDFAQYIRNANNGTLYLAHIDRLSKREQHILRRLLREHVVRPKDESSPLRVSVRVVASVVGKLGDLSAKGDFMPELFYLLCPLQLHIPPLRSRPEDLEQYIDLCLGDCLAKLNRYVVLTKEARKVLLNYPWPGNYTQLQTFLERAVITAPSRTLRDGYLQDLLHELYPFPDGQKKSTPTNEVSSAAQNIIDALSRNKGNREATAKELGISKTTLWRKMKHLGIRDYYSKSEI